LVKQHIAQLVVRQTLDHYLLSIINHAVVACFVTAKLTDVDLTEAFALTVVAEVLLIAVWLAETHLYFAVIAWFIHVVLELARFVKASL
jgi:hypothetical protein